MARIEVGNGQLTVHLQGWDRWLALRRRLRVPLARVAEVKVRPPEARWNAPGIKIAGAFLPRRIAAGLFKVPGGWAFYAVHDPDRTIGVELRGRGLRRLVVQVDGETPEEAARRIRDALP
jgi:hypothetical protein